MTSVDPIPALKQRAAARIADMIRDCSVLDVAMTMQIDARRVCDLRACRVERFSLEFLLRLLVRLRARVEISVNGTAL